MVISEGLWHSHLLPSVGLWSFHYLFLQLMSVAAEVQTPNPPHARQTLLRTAPPQRYLCFQNKWYNETQDENRKPGSACFFLNNDSQRLIVRSTESIFNAINQNAMSPSSSIFRYILMTCWPKWLMKKSQIEFDTLTIVLSKFVLKWNSDHTSYLIKCRWR